MSRGTDFGPWSCPSVAIVCLQSPPAGSRPGSGVGAARCKDSQPEARACCKGVTCASPPQAQQTQQLVTTLLQAACIPTGAASGVGVPMRWWILPHSDRGSRDCIRCQPICLSDRVLVKRRAIFVCRTRNAPRCLLASWLPGTCGTCCHCITGWPSTSSVGNAHNVTSSAVSEFKAVREPFRSLHAI